MNRARLIVADRQKLIVDALRLMIRDADHEVVATVSDGHSLLDAAHRLKPDLVITDVLLPGIDGLEVARVLHSTTPSVKTVILSAEEDPVLIKEAFAAGAAGVVWKGNAGSDLIRVIRLVLDGKTRVTGYPLAASRGRTATHCQPSAGGPRPTEISSRQVEVLRLVAQGLDRKTIAERLHISVKTVEFHKALLAKQLRLRNDVDYLRYALEHGLLSLTEDKPRKSAAGSFSDG